jgi:hypothetical protein
MAGLGNLLKDTIGAVIGGPITDQQIQAAIDALLALGYNTSTDFLPNSRFASVKLISNAPTQINQAIAGNSQRNQIAGHYWTAEVSYTDLDATTYRDVMGFIASRRVGLTDFFVILPEFSVPAGDVGKMAQDTLTVTAARSTGQTSIAADFAIHTSTSMTSAGLDPTKAFRRGDFISFSNHSKMYQLTADATMNSSGNVTLSIYPGLFTNITTSTTINYFPAVFKFFIAASEQEYTASVGDSRGLVIKLQESI